MNKYQEEKAKKLGEEIAEKEMNIRTKLLENISKDIHHHINLYKTDLITICLQTVTKLIKEDNTNVKQ